MGYTTGVADQAETLAQRAGSTCYKHGPARTSPAFSWDFSIQLRERYLCGELCSSEFSVSRRRWAGGPVVGGKVRHNNGVGHNGTNPRQELRKRTVGRFRGREENGGTVPYSFVPCLLRLYCVSVYYGSTVSPGSLRTSPVLRSSGKCFWAGQIPKYPRQRRFAHSVMMKRVHTYTVLYESRTFVCHSTAYSLPYLGAPPLCIIVRTEVETCSADFRPRLIEVSKPKRQAIDQQTNNSQQHNGCGRIAYPNQSNNLTKPRK